jgi:hypothetical protein
MNGVPKRMLYRSEEQPLIITLGRFGKAAPFQFAICQNQGFWLQLPNLHKIGYARIRHLEHSLDREIWTQNTIVMEHL